MGHWNAHKMMCALVNKAKVPADVAGSPKPSGDNLGLVASPRATSTPPENPEEYSRWLDAISAQLYQE
eukprot:gene14885-4422_t